MSDFMKDPSGDWHIENDVLVTKNGTAFLAGGNQQTLKYATGELSPSPSSVRAFADNIRGRFEHARSLKLPYAHVIFPDKQSILDSEFPLRPLIKLGETHLKDMPADTASLVIYPVPELQAEGDACMPLDTHLSATGTLVVLERMLRHIQLDADAALERVRSRIVQPYSWTGDLGNKLDPPRTQEVLVLSPDWEHTLLNSGGGFNDGMVDIVLSPHAPVNRTVLLFGDSFFRQMLKHLSGVFTRVVLLRTRYYHREMVELIEPDIIFSGNAERYLAHVDIDDNAIPFMLYRDTRGIVDTFEPDFLEGWRAMTSPRAKVSHDYFASRGVDRVRR